ncbi:STAS domain-containing protein [Streptomyces sp. NPDC058611]|uniref:STAS domain-containing protein n=1 Tax=unclassified Streptomyces TaxID=2593676 RepID=UPI003651F7F3
MTMPLPSPLRLTRVDTKDVVRIELHGDFDYQYATVLLDAVMRVLAEPAAPRELYLDCTGLSAVDSTGLSTLLMAKRLTDSAGVRLRLGGRPVNLDRMLTVTGTLDHLTGQSAGERSESSVRERQSAASEEPVTPRSSGPETTT